tara:strand:- start:318 stop:608 length:291 start_codon:yes stop_codon:yes gene_type:complete
MPLYPVKNLKTGETKDIHMSVEKYGVWREENPDWDKDWSQGCAGLRSLGPESYNTDAICSPGAYEDKNNSLADPTGGIGSASGPNNDCVKEHYRMK